MLRIVRHAHKAGYLIRYSKLWEIWTDFILFLVNFHQWYHTYSLLPFMHSCFCIAFYFLHLSIKGCSYSYPSLILQTQRVGDSFILYTLDHWESCCRQRKSLNFQLWGEIKRIASKCFLKPIYNDIHYSLCWWIDSIIYLFVAVYAELQATDYFETMTVRADEEEHSLEMMLPYIAKVFNQ